MSQAQSQAQAQSRALEAFLASRTLEINDLYAKRAVRALRRLGDMQRNAYDRGDQEGFARCQHALECALNAFGCVNSEKDFDFAAAVHPGALGMTEACKDIFQASRYAPGLVHHAELVVKELGDRLTPPCTVSGVSSVAILRGAHCLAAVSGLTAVNDN